MDKVSDRQRDPDQPHPLNQIQRTDKIFIAEAIIVVMLITLGWLLFFVTAGNLGAK